MKRVNYHLPEDQLARVQDLASRLGITAAELIRRALDRELAAHSPPAPETPRMATAKSARKATMSPAQEYIFKATREGKVSEVRRIGIDNIVMDDQYQSREKLDTNYAHSELLPLLEQFGDLEPVVLFKEHGSERLFMANGFHRHWTYKHAKRPDIPAFIIDAGEEWERELRLYSASANLKFSKPPTKEDKTKALRMLFADEECWTWNYRELARRSGLSNSTTVINMRMYSEETKRPITDQMKVFTGKNTFKWCPRTTSQFRKLVPRKKSDGKNRYAVKVDGESYCFTAGSQESAQEKADMIGASVQARVISEKVNRTSLSNNGLRYWLVNKGLIADQISAIGIHLLKCERALVASCRNPESQEIVNAVSALMFAWKRDGFPGVDLVIACYRVDWVHPMIQEIVETLSAPGLFQIHFLTPEEIVQRYAPQEGQADQGGNGFQGDEA